MAKKLSRKSSKGIYDIKDKVKTVKLSSLKLYERNAKIHPDQQVNLLDKGINKYSYVNPIVVGTDNVIIGGHGRYLAMMRQSPNSKVDVIDASFLPKNHQDELRLFLNKSSSQKYDNDILQEEVNRIYQNSKKDIDEIDQLLREVQEDVEQDLMDDPQEEELRPYKKIHFLISFHPDLFSKVKKHLEKIQEIAGVEIEQGAN